MKIPFGTQAYQHEATQLSSQQMVNCFIEQQVEGSKSPLAVIRTPGIKQLTQLPTGPVRGGLVHDNAPFFVSGGKLYRLTGSAYTEIGGIPGTDRVVMASNGAQLGILTNGSLYVYETALEKVTDDGFYTASDMTYSDLFLVLVKQNSQDIFVNDSAAVPFPDMTEYNALDFRTAEAKPGNIVAIETDHREILVFKEETTEIWTKTNDPDFPFTPVPNAFMELGCIARDSVARADNTVFWLANDMTIRRADGYTPRRVSTHAIENAITKMTRRDDAYAFAHPFNGHIFYVLTFPSDNRTFVYDITTGVWHERSTDGAEWRANCYVFHDDRHLVGDALSGNIGQLQGNEYEDLEQVHRVTVTAPSVHLDGRYLFHKRLHIDFDMGRGLITGQGQDPQAMLSWSDDGGVTWSSEYWRSLGKIGEYRVRAVWNRLGRSRDRVYRLQFSDPTPFTLIEAILDVDVGQT